jgi:hypothetical protein
MVNCTEKQIRELKAALRWKIPEAQRQCMQMVLLRESGMTQPSIAEAMGVSLSFRGCRRGCCRAHRSCRSSIFSSCSSKPACLVDGTA